MLESGGLDGSVLSACWPGGMSVSLERVERARVRFLLKLLLFSYASW